MSTKKKRKLWIVGVVTVLVTASLLYVFVFKPQPEPYTSPITDAAGNFVPGSIAVIETVNLGGVEQTITLRGNDTSNPILLFLHGGPGMPSSPWATWNEYHAELEKHFILVHWDQRGAGKSYSKDLTPEDMQWEDFVDDTLELTNILRERFGQEKIFLYGHSWGSGLGFEVLEVNPEPYYAYFASGVRVTWNSSQEISYQNLLDFARQENDTKAIEALEAIQPFDPANTEHLQVKGEYLSHFLVGDFHTPGLEEAWLNHVLKGNSSEYPKSTIRPTLAGKELTDGTLGVEIMTVGYDLTTDFPDSPIPVHFFQGRYDYECPGELVEAYYNILEAPDKSFTWFENSAHDIYYDEANAFNQLVIQLAGEILADYED